MWKINSMKKGPVLILFFLSVVFAYPQNKDSLLQVLKTAKHDTTKAQILTMLLETEYDPNVYIKYTQQLNAICQKYLQKGKQDPLYTFALKNYSSHLANLANYQIERGSLDSGIYYLNKAMDIKKGLGDKEGTVVVLINLGYIYNQKGDYQKALDQYKLALDLSKELGNKSFIASCYNNMGSAYQAMGMIEKFTECAFAAMKIREEMGDQTGLYYSYNNVASYYSDIGDNDKAIEYYEKGLVLARKMKLNDALSRTLSNIANSLARKNEHEKARKYFKESYRIADSVGDKGGMALALANLGYNLYKYDNNIAEGIALTTEAVKLWEQVGFKDQICLDYSTLGKMCYDAGNYKDAETYALKALNLSREIAMPKNIATASFILKKVYTKLGMYKEALEISDLAQKMTDSLDNVELRKASYKQGIKYEYEKKAAADSVIVSEEKKTCKLKLENVITQI
jgi:tetratricopeptide (TPR) repeat protein